MQKKLSLICITFLIVLTFMMGIASFCASSLLAYASNGDLYYSTQNKPVIYGTSKITMSQNAVSTFSIQDARFRTFARDFEDGDLFVQCTSQDVNPTVAGNYNIHYTVTDSHGNTSSLDVPVIVTNDNNATVTVERIVYTLPNDWNFQLMGVNRCNTGDRQNFGIYLPAGQFFKYRVLDGNSIKSKLKDQNEKSKIELTNNDQRTESKHRIDYTQTGFTTIQNTFTELNGQTQKDSVPLLTSPLLARGVDVNTTFKVEIQYNTTQVRPLQYYYYRDNEEKFTNDWAATNDEYAMIENEVATILLTRADIYTTKNEPRAFRSYDSVFEYYVKVVQRMDEILGVSLNPDKAVHQNFRAKYLMRANNKGAGEAYYGGDHIGVSAANAGYFLIMGWGTLHEIAHGYQGYLGKGTMDLLEVSNNILCHYIQMDKDIYTKNEDWLRKHEEDLRNQDRLNGKIFTQTSLQTRLYALINLLDYFEGPDTYAKMFRWYRERMLSGEFKTNTPNQDMYALFFAEVYNTNILPYWNQWGLQVNETTIDTVAKASKSISILKDSAGDKYTDIINGEHLNFSTDKYKPIADSILKEYGVLSNFSVTIYIDNTDALRNRQFFLEQGGVIQYQKSIIYGTVEFTDIATGSYYLRAPAITGYQREIKYVTLKQGQNYAEITYTPVDITGFHSTILGIRGVWDHGYKLQLDNRTAQGGYADHPTQGKITLTNAELDQRGDSAWVSKPKEVYASVRVLDTHGNIVHYADVKGNGFFNDSSTPIETTVPLDVGYIVEVYTHAPIRIQVLSSITNQKMDEFEYIGPRPVNSIYKEFYFTYKIIKEGFQIVKYQAMPEKGSTEAEYTGTTHKDFVAADIIYNSIKNLTIAELDKLNAYFEQNPQNLENKGIDELLKQSYISNYYKLQEVDRAPYTEILDKILKGGLPTITVIKDNIVVDKMTDLVFSQYISVFDNEDREIQLTTSNHLIESSGDLSKAGSYVITLHVYDADGNMSTCSLNVKILNETKAPSKNVLSIVLIVGGILLVLAVVAIVLFLCLSKKKKAKIH